MKREYELVQAIEFFRAEHIKSLNEGARRNAAGERSITSAEIAAGIESECWGVLRLIAWWDESATLEEFYAKVRDGGQEPN